MNRYSKIGLLYVALLHIVCGVLLYKSDYVSKLKAEVDQNAQSESHAGYYDRMVSYHQRMDGSIPDGATLFLGDSITQSLATSLVSDLSFNFGVGSDTTEGVLKRLPLYKSANKAKAIVLAIGINDLDKRTDDEIVVNYRKILDYFSQGQLIVANAILPVDERVELAPSLTNKRIEDLNSKLAVLVSGYKHANYVNAGVRLVDLNGDLSTKFHVGDGVHLNSDGYQIWITLLKEVLENT